MRLRARARGAEMVLDTCARRVGHLVGLRTRSSTFECSRPRFVPRLSEHTLEELGTHSGALGVDFVPL